MAPAGGLCAPPGTCSSYSNFSGVRIFRSFMVDGRIGIFAFCSTIFQLYEDNGNIVMKVEELDSMN